MASVASSLFSTSRRSERDCAERIIAARHEMAQNTATRERKGRKGRSSIVVGVSPSVDAIFFMCALYDSELFMPSADLHQDLRRGVRDLCKAFPDSYWRELDAARGYPDAFVRALTDAGYLAALIPEEYGGSGLGGTEASLLL